MNLTAHKHFRPAVGAVVTVLCGLLLWRTPLYENASYDNILRFGSHKVTNEVVVILMDNASRLELGLNDEKWPRDLHAKLLDRLADDGCSLVVLDVFFRTNREPVSDEALKRALERQQDVILMAEQTIPWHTGMAMVTAAEPWSELLRVAGSHHWGIAWFATDKTNGIVRQHWPFPSPEGDPSLSWTAAQVAGAQLSQEPERRWLRYYGDRNHTPWKGLSYGFALMQPEGFYHNKVVFIGDFERDQWQSPYGEFWGGVEIHATQFLNLVNGDWLRRPHWSIELLLLLLLGTASGAGLYYLRPWVGALATLAAMVLVLVGTVLLYQKANVWIPWLVIVGGQLPCAWLCSLPRRPRVVPAVVPEEAKTVVDDRKVAVEIPYTPDYQRVRKLGEGGFGEVWLVRNAIGQWQALKVVYRRSFEEERHYNYEFEGIEKYKPVSEKHQGLLRVELISHKRPEGYYYYVMELGDSLVPGWEEEPDLYQADTLWSRCKLAEPHRLSVKHCARIGVVLAEALHCLHQSGLTHRDVKPQNVIFVDGQPKLADVGLVTHTRPADTESTQVGTPGYMPPEPEPSGTVQADVYALGMVLYVISTAGTPQLFPELSKTLLGRSSSPDFLRLNPVILKACHPDCSHRYQTAAELRDALLQVQDGLNGDAGTI